MKREKADLSKSFFTTHDIGRMTGTDPTTVYKWVDQGLLRGYRTPGGHRRVRAEDLKAFLAAHQMPLPPELGGSAGIRIMVVDDDAAALKAVVRALKRAKPEWDVVTADSGILALLQVPSLRPDVLVFDVFMPEVDGLALCKRLQANPETQALRLVGMTGRYSTDLEKRILAVGARTLLKKPLGGQELVDGVELALGLRPAANAS